MLYVLFFFFWVVSLSNDVILFCDLMFDIVLRIDTSQCEGSCHGASSKRNELILRMSLYTFVNRCHKTVFIASTS